LTRIESDAFYESSLQFILIPSIILFIASDATEITSEIKLIDGDSCPEFARWLQLKRSGIRVDFRRIEKVGLSLPCLKDYHLNISEFKERSIICELGAESNGIYDRVEDEFSVFVKSIALREGLEETEMEKEIEKLMNLRHPCVAGLIGFVVEIETGILQELKIVRLYCEGSSLSEVISVNPVWWTSTVKAKVVAGIVLGLRFAHSLGLFHGRLSARNILFDLNHCIQIVNFDPIVLEVVERESESENETEEGMQLGGMSGEEWRLERDIRAFASILFEIVAGGSATGAASIPASIPSFVAKIIELGLYRTFIEKYSFSDIFEILKQNNFRIEDGVDSEEVSTFASWVESAEHPDQ
jgi:serine/threonine protein kinase